MRIGLDAMGGDLGTATVVAGALDARDCLAADDTIVLFGQEDVILEALGGEVPAQIEIVHAPDVIAMDEKPVVALKSKPHSSIAVMTKAQKLGQIDACISAGNTGACVAAAHMLLGRLAGVERPGIAVMASTPGGAVAVCDCGANMAARPQHLYQYGVMTSLYVQAVQGIESPRVGLMSVGEEDSKGNDLVRQTAELLRADDKLNFIGNIEGRDFPKGVCDVIVCDGFVGNIILKLVEGVGASLMKQVAMALITAMPEKTEEILGVGEQFRLQYDFNQYGAQPLLGVNGVWMIAHGATAQHGFVSAIKNARECITHHVNDHIVEHLQQA